MRDKIFLSVLITTAITVFSVSCGNEGVRKDQPPVDINKLSKAKPETRGPVISESQVEITHPLNTDWVSDGKKIYELKCQPCHKLTEEKLVGPGWKDVTRRRTPVWIMNMITNTDLMLDKDPEAQKLLELCMVRMPNQNLSFDQARHVLEFQRNNDGEK